MEIALRYLPSYSRATIYSRPATLAPLSLINLQVAVGGQNVLNSTLNMTYENFLQQVNFRNN